jgi:hypothetical protein
MTTYTAYIAALAGLTISGVERKYTSQPDNVDTADLPASFPRLPNGGTNEDTMTTCQGDGKTRTAELIVVIEPTGQSTSAANFANTVTMCDSIETALDGLSIMPIITYTIDASLAIVPGYWAIVATVTGIE